MVISICNTLSMLLKFVMYMCLAVSFICWVDYQVNNGSSGVVLVGSQEQKTITRDEFIALIPKEIPQEYHELLYDTAHYESGLVVGAKQKGGEALGIMQVEPNTEADIWEHFLKYRPNIKESVERYKGDLRYDTQYNIYIGYLVYYRNLYNKKVDLSDKWQRAWLYKKYYNTHKGKGTTKGFYYGRG